MLTTQLRTKNKNFLPLSTRSKNFFLRSEGKGDIGWGVKKKCVLLLFYKFLFLKYRIKECQKKSKQKCLSIELRHSVSISLRDKRDLKKNLSNTTKPLIPRRLVKRMGREEKLGRKFKGRDEMKQSVFFSLINGN